MPELLIHSTDGDKRISFSNMPLISDLIAGIPDSPGKPCGGSGKCGKCAVYAKGQLNPGPDTNGKVLSCQTRLIGDGEIWLPKKQAMKQIETKAFGAAYDHLPMKGKLALAVDIGTTTLAVRLLRLADGEILSTVACENPQRTVAADVIGRIDAAMKGQLKMQAHMIREAVDAMEQEAIHLAGLSVAQTDYRVITGNTTMLYLFTNRNPEALSHSPFQADCLFDYWEGRDYYPPCTGAFVGADITCALLFSGLCEKDETALLIDIGTNGEIALWHQGRITSCATAAGPAFEGGGIEWGCGSIHGAIDSARADHGKLDFTTIGGGAAKGICGSGLIDLTAALLDLAWVDEMGMLDEKEIMLFDPVRITQKDIRQIQLAKGAIAAGIQSLLQIEKVGFSEVKALYIAGGFGSHLNLESAVRIGLIPAQWKEKAIVLGNAALGGAQRMLLDQSSGEKIRKIAQSTTCINLAETACFSDAFVECMMFES